jgi:hypothetical protein
MLQGLAKSICVNAQKGSAVDNTPAAVDWTNTSGVRPVKSSITVTTIGQQITSISSSIDLTVTNSTSLRIGDLTYGVNSTNTTPSTFTSILSGSPITGTNSVSSTFSVSNNQWLFFRFIVGSSVGGYGAGTTTLTVTNSTELTTLDTWVHTNT